MSIDDRHAIAYISPMGTSIENSLERTGFKVTALVLSRLRRSDISAEYARLGELPRTQAWGHVAAVLATLFVAALIAASFGWIGLAVYFGAALLIFR
ncbi:MAG: hypothetical protein AAF965_04555 [Pseudomonadota bacterium]